MSNYIFWSGGKDSTATIILAHQLGIPVDGVVFCEVMFDHSRNISGEDPDHIRWIRDYAIPLIESDFGIPVIILKSEKDFLSVFNHRITRSFTHPERIGKKRGFPLPGMCSISRDLKNKPIAAFRKSHPEMTEFVGIAVDEPTRYARLGNNCRSLLYELGIPENVALQLCEKCGLLSPIYSRDVQRQGCWFCPNNAPHFKELNSRYPELITELLMLSEDPDLIYPHFARGRDVISYL